MKDVITEITFQLDNEDSLKLTIKGNKNSQFHFGTLRLFLVMDEVGSPTANVCPDCDEGSELRININGAPAVDRRQVLSSLKVAATKNAETAQVIAALRSAIEVR